MLVQKTSAAIAAAQSVIRNLESVIAGRDGTGGRAVSALQDFAKYVNAVEAEQRALRQELDALRQRLQQLAPAETPPAG